MVKNILKENWTSKNPFNARDDNPANEDEYMRNRAEVLRKRKNIPPQPPKPEVPSLPAMQRDVLSWSNEDLDKVMQSQDYQFNHLTQKKGKKIF